MTEQKQVSRIAVLDLYNGEPNEGMRCIRLLVSQFIERFPGEVHCEIFDVRQKNQVPDLSYDAYISSGGPGSPLESEGEPWDNAWCNWLDEVVAHNATSGNRQKHVLLICHSFQLFMRHFQLATVAPRKSTAFGIMPVHKTAAGQKEPLFAGLTDPFFAVDSREWQVIEPDKGRLKEKGVVLTSIEKYRPHIKLERAIMSMRMGDAVVGTQFHPEADVQGMYRYLIREEKKKVIIENHGRRKYNEMLDGLADPDKIGKTFGTVVPGFLDKALPVPTKAYMA